MMSKINNCRYERVSVPIDNNNVAKRINNKNLARIIKVRKILKQAKTKNHILSLENLDLLTEYKKNNNQIHGVVKIGLPSFVKRKFKNSTINLAEGTVFGGSNKNS